MEMDTLEYKASLRKAYQAAFLLLSMREYSSRDLQKRLLQKGYSAEIVQSVLNELSRQGLQSDRRFIESYVRSRKRRGFSLRRIRLELEQQGISYSTLAPFLEETPEDWQQHILQVWKKKFHGKKPEIISEKAKQTRFLQHRGFTWEQIRWVWELE